MGPSANPSADGPAPSDVSGSGAGDARFERLGRRCGVTFAEPSDPGCWVSLVRPAKSACVRGWDLNLVPPVHPRS